MADVRGTEQCQGCGKVDTDPKHHFGPQSFHFDCSPFYVVQDMTHVTNWQWDPETHQYVNKGVTPIPEENLHPQTKHFLAVREAAMSGTRGDALLAHIDALHQEMQPHTDEAGAAQFTEFVDGVTNGGN